MKSFDDFFEYFFSLGKGLCVFPNVQTRYFWTTYLAKKYHCISLEHFLTLHQFQQRLQKKILQKENNASRFLTSQETNIMLAILLQNPHVQRYVLEIEQLESLPNRKNFCDKLHQTYTSKLYQILKQHILYESFPSSLTPKIQAILLLYTKLLSNYECMDSIVLSHLMKNKMLAQHTENPFHLFLLCANLFHPQDLLWSQYFGKSMQTQQSSSSNGMFLQTSHSFIESIKNKFFTYQQVEINNIPMRDSLPKFPEILHHKIDTQDTPILHVYENSALEFENIFSSIRQLLSEGTPPHEISLMICQYNQTIESELLSLAQKYQVPLALHQLQKSSEYLLLSLLQEAYHSHFNPQVLKRLFFEPCFPWKRREQHNNIVTLGLENSCINDKSLYQWKSILYSHEEDAKYFHFFVKCVRNIISSKNFKELYKNLELFGSSFFTQKMRALGTYDIDEPALINIILKKCEILFSFEKYLNNQNQAISYYNKIDPWNILLNSCGDNSGTNNNKYSSVQIAIFPHALGTGPAYQFICNLSQRAIVQTTSFRSVFNDYLSRAYNGENISDAYKKYTHALLDYISSNSHCLYLSASIENNEGTNILPIYWNTHRITHIQDIWKEEMKCWNAQKFPEKFYISKSQKQGLLYIKELKLENFSQPYSITYKGVPEELYLATFPKNQSISINATSASIIFNPEIFYLSEVLKLKPFFPEHNITMNETLVWGNLYHKQAEAMLMEQLCLPKDLQTKKLIDKNSQSSSDTGILQGMFYHPYIRETIEHAFKDLNLKQHITYLQSMLPQNQSSDKTLIRIEETLESGLNQILDAISQNPKYTALINNLNHKIIRAISIRGRADLLYKHSEEALYHVIDFKRANSEYNITGLFQTWLYFIIINHDFFDTKDFLSLLDKDNKCYGSLYFVAESTDSENHIYPGKEADLKEQEILIIQNMPQAFIQALSLLSHLHKGIDNIQASTKKLDNPTINHFRDDEMPLYIKNILREGCYIYVK